MTGAGAADVPDGELYPRCPVWCREPDRHDVPIHGLRAGELLRRKHVGDLTGPDGAAEVRIERVDDVFVGGPVLAGYPVIVVEPVDGALTVGEFRALAAELGRVVGNLVDLDLGDPLGLVDGPDRAADGER